MSTASAGASAGAPRFITTQAQPRADGSSQGQSAFAFAGKHNAAAGGAVTLGSCGGAAAAPLPPGSLGAAANPQARALAATLQSAAKQRVGSCHPKRRGIVERHAVSCANSHRRDVRSTPAVRPPPLNCRSLLRARCSACRQPRARRRQREQRQGTRRMRPAARARGHRRTATAASRLGTSSCTRPACARRWARPSCPSSSSGGPRRAPPPLPAWQVAAWAPRRVARLSRWPGVPAAAAEARLSASSAPKVGSWPRECVAAWLSNHACTLMCLRYFISFQIHLVLCAALHCHRRLQATPPCSTLPPPPPACCFRHLRPTPQPRAWQG